jgi:PHD and RING finger domain-containing protein 1
VPDSTSEDSEKCPICLVTFAEQDTGTPDTCDHTFCVGCLKEWSKIVNTCPIDRQMFNVILVRRCPDRRIIERMPVRPRQLENQHEVIVDIAVAFCEQCGGCDREDHMITCTACHCIYHPECLIYPLDAIPSEEWFCSECTMTSLPYYAD